MCSYVRYANTAAAALRAVVRGGEARLAALRREEQFARVAAWTAGKSAEPVGLFCPSTATILASQS